METVNYKLKRLYKGKWQPEILKIFVRTGDRMAIFDGFTEKKLLMELTPEQADKLYGEGLLIEGHLYKGTQKQAGRTKYSITTFKIS